jgi:hypothetical protein
MEHEPGGYLKLQAKQFPARSLRETAEGRYWKQYKAPVFAKQVRASCVASASVCVCVCLCVCVCVCVCVCACAHLCRLD